MPQNAIHVHVHHNPSELYERGPTAIASSAKPQESLIVVVGPLKGDYRPAQRIIRALRPAQPTRSIGGSSLNRRFDTSDSSA
jgi:hypothetical protein